MIALPLQGLLREERHYQWPQCAKLRVCLSVFPLSPHRTQATFSGMSMQQPGSVNEHTDARFWFGTDSTGRDVFARLVFGARISLTIGLVATGLSMVIGVFIGALSGFMGGWIDLVLQRIVEIMMNLPVFIIILVVIAILGPNIFLIMTVIGLTGWAGTARLVRGEFLSHQGRDYVLAARSLGLSHMRIMFRHILPNILTPLIHFRGF